PFTDLGPLLPQSPPEITKGFAPNGFYSGPAGPNPLTIEGPIYGSFPDANQGSIRLGPIQLDAQMEIAIPIVTGPDPAPLSIAIRDADTHAVLTQMAPPPVRTQWWAWHPDLPTDHD